MQHVATLRGGWEVPTQARVQREPETSEATTTQTRIKGKRFLITASCGTLKADSDFSVWNQIKKQILSSFFSPRPPQSPDICM